MGAFFLVLVNMTANIDPQLFNKFQALINKPVSEQTEFFLKSFIFALDTQWKKLIELSKTFNKYLQDYGQAEGDTACALDPSQAADFLQKNGKTRTAMQRRTEIRDIDIDNNDRITFIEYLLLHYKAMIITEYYKRTGESNPYDLSQDGIGVTGVGQILLDELFTLPLGLEPALAKAIEEYTSTKKARETQMKTLSEKAAAGGVRGMAAKNELEQLEAQDSTDMNRLELTLNAAKKRAAKKSGEEAVRDRKAQEEAAAKAKAEESRAKLKARAALWN